MIPTREQIDVSNGILCAMRDEIDRLTAELAGDGKALRELREWILEMWWVASQGKWETGALTAGKVVGRIDEMLARPAPSKVYSRGKTIAESAEPPTAYYPPAPVEIWPEEMKRQTLVGKFEPAPVEKPAAAVPDHVPDAGKMVPDDTRELVAQLADAVVTLCDGQGFGITLSEVQAIAKQLRGGA